MAVNLPRFGTFNYGDVMKTKQDLEFGEMRNEATGMELNAQKEQNKNRARANEIRQQIEGIPDQIAQMESQGLFDEAQNLRESYIGMKVNEADIIKSQRLGLTADNYDQWRYDMIQSGAVDDEMLPVEYPGDQWFRNKEQEVKNKINVQSRTYTDEATGKVMTQDFVSDEFGAVEWEGNPYEDPKKQPGSGDGSGGKPWQMSSGDSNAIRNSAAQLYGTMWDPVTQQYAGLNKQQSQDVAKITELAAKIYNEHKGQKPHNVAVAEAAREADIPIEELQQPGRPDPNDPMGWRQ